MTTRPYTITDWQARAIAEDRLGLNTREDFATELCDLWPANPWCAFGRVKAPKMNVEAV